MGCVVVAEEAARGTRYPLPLLLAYTTKRAPGDASQQFQKDLTALKALMTRFTRVSTRTKISQIRKLFQENDLDINDIRECLELGLYTKHNDDTISLAISKKSYADYKVAPSADARDKIRIQNGVGKYTKPAIIQRLTIIKPVDLMPPAPIQPSIVPAYFGLRGGEDGYGRDGMEGEEEEEKGAEEAAARAARERELQAEVRQ